LWTAFGGLEDYFLCTDSEFVDREDLNLVADSSGDGFNTWISEEADTIYDVFGRYYDMLAEQGITIDTTIEMYYVFVVKSRDDADVADISPEFKTFTVIDPHYERDVAVIDFVDASVRNLTVYRNNDTSKAYWTNTLRKWKPDIVFDTTTLPNSPDGTWRSQAPDYFRTSYSYLKLVELLKHKILIVSHDDIRYPAFNDKSEPIYTAIDAGVNVWVTARALLKGSLSACEDFNVPIPSDFAFYFGVQGTVYSGWFGQFANPVCQYYPGNCADFYGAYSIDSTKWPNLTIDTTLLKNRYRWRGTSAHPYDWNPDLPCLPEVNWASRGIGTEVMYLYKSFYGDSHPMGQDFNYEGSPVAHRKGTTAYRTVHCSFTPLGIDSLQMQVLADSILNWLYPEDLGDQSVSVVNRYPVKISLEAAQDNFVRRRQESLKSKEDALDVILR